MTGLEEVAFGPFRVDIARRQLLRGSERIALQPKAFDLLVLLIEARDAVLTKEVLMDRLWPDTVVEESNLTQTVYVLRRALGNEYVVTVPKRGYRFTGFEEWRTGNPACPSGGFESDRHDYLSSTTPGRTRVLTTLGAVAIAIAVLVALWLARPRATIAAGPASMMKVTRTGDVTNAAISPDGRSVAYIVDERGARSLWLKDIASKQTRALIAPAEVRYGGLTFARDGQAIYFVRFATNAPLSSSPQIAGAGGALFRISLRGGAPTQITDYVSSPVAASPDGRIAFVRGSQTSPATQLVVANADGSSEKVVATRRRPSFLSNAGPAWSPDGTHIALGATPNERGAPMNVVEIDVRSAAERPFSTKAWLTIGRVVWQDAKSLLIAATDEESKPPHVWKISRDEPPQRVTNDFNNYAHLTATADGSSVVAIQSERLATLWLMPIGNAQAARAITRGGSGIDGSMGLAFAGSDIVYTSLASDRLDLWRTTRSGEKTKQLTDDGFLDRYPTASLDGRYVVYESNRSGAFNLWRTTDGGGTVRLTNGSGEFAPRFSADGSSIVYSAAEGDRMTLRSVPVAGGQSIKLTEYSGSNPVLSPDGRWVACQIRGEPTDPRPQIGIIATDGRAPMRVIALPRTAFQIGALALQWTRDGRGIAFIDNRGGVSNILVQPLDGGPPAALTNFDSDRIFYFDLSSDGKWLVLSRGRINSDAVIIKAEGGGRKAEG